MSATTIRPPWPDERIRIHAAFPTLRPVPGMHPLVLAAAGSPERIVAVAGLLPPPAPGGSAAVTCASRLRHLASLGALTLLEKMAELAQTLGASEIVTLDDLRENDVRIPWLQRAGFVFSHADEIWQIDFAAMSVRLARIHAALESRGRLAGFTAGPLEESLVPEVQALLEAAGLFAPGRVRLAPQHPDGYDPQVSTVVRANGRVVAAALVKRRNTVAIVEARAVDPRFIGKFDVPNHLCFQRSVKISLEVGLSSLLFTANPAKDRETIRMAGRFNGRLASRSLHLSKRLAGSIHQTNRADQYSA